GHEDAIHIMRGSRGVTSRDIRKVVHFPESRKPVPIVPKRFIAGVSERVEWFGEVVVPLHESEAGDAIRYLIDQNVEAIGVCFLWSFKEPRHELRLKEMIRDLAPHLFISCSVDIAPKWGEYERMTATVLNAYIGPVMAKYLGNLDRRLKASGYAQPLQITQCAGGSISVDKAMESPLLTLDSGPVCYGKGGTTATVTDADVVLGTINPENFLGGRMRLDREKAIAAVQRVAAPLKLSLMEAASGIARIAEFKMADIIRKMTVEKGFDPRDFVLFAFGGAGPAHAGVFAYELGVQRVVIPQKEIASTWCAFGAASADILHVHEQVDIQASPFDAAL